MLAVMKTKPVAKELEVREVAEPTLTPGHALAKVDAVGICGTDVHIYNWELGYRTRLGDRLPVTMGHEFTGTLVDMDGESPDFKVGDRVVAIPAVGCGECYYCKNGNREICLNRKPIGLEYPGAMANYVLLDKNQIFRLPSDFPITLGAAIEPMTVAYNAVFKAGSLLGKTVVIIGPGAIGYFAAVFAYLAGATDISISGLPNDEPRFEVFRRCLPSVHIFTDGEALKQHVMEISNGIGVDVVLEISGSGGGLSSAIDLTKKRAALVMVGIASKPLTVDAISIVRKELRLFGTHVLPPKLWREMIALIYSLDQQSKDLLEAAITHRFPLSKAEEAFKTVESCTGLKVLLDPNK